MNTSETGSRNRETLRKLNNGEITLKEILPSVNLIVCRSLDGGAITDEAINNAQMSIELLEQLLKNCEPGRLPYNGCSFDTREGVLYPDSPDFVAKYRKDKGYNL